LRTNKQSKQANKQASKQASKQANKQTKQAHKKQTNKKATNKQTIKRRCIDSACPIRPHPTWCGAQKLVDDGARHRRRERLPREAERAVRARDLGEQLVVRPRRAPPRCG
jgi:hypothetical protein